MTNRKQSQKYMLISETKRASGKMPTTADSFTGKKAGTPECDSQRQSPGPFVPGKR